VRKWRSAPAAAAVAVLTVLLATGASGGGSWEPARPGYEWSFPRDHWTHPGYRNEWWYFVGHLESDDGRRFGYQLTFFRVGLSPDPPAGESQWAASDLVMGHAALTDPSAGEHRFGEVLQRAVPLLGGFNRFPTPVLAWIRAPAGTDGTWTVRRVDGRFELAMVDDGAGFALALQAEDGGPPVLQGPGGYSRKSSDGAASLYYSLPRMPTTGTLTLDGRTLAVRGTSWMDREFGSGQLGADQAGWDWFGLGLDDGRALMLYRMRRSDGDPDLVHATLVGADGRVRFLEPGEWSLEVTGTWESPASGTRYPAGWRARVPGEGLDLSILPDVADQENRARRAGGIDYWEGSVRLRDPVGAAVGRGYVELTGYGDGNRPAV